jgi:putative oxidoreductase
MAPVKVLPASARKSKEKLMNPSSTIPPSSIESENPSRFAARGQLWHGLTTIGGRALIALLFVLAGAVKILNPAPFVAHMAQFGLPAFLLPAVIALELGAGTAILLGWRLRYSAGALAIFCVLTAAIFHHQLGINAERTLFFKDLALAGGLMVMAANALPLHQTCKE